MPDKESKGPYNSISRVIRDSEYIMRPETRDAIEAVFFLDMEGSLNQKMPPKQRELLKIAIDDSYLPDDKGYLGVWFFHESGGPIMRVVTKQCEDCPSDPSGKKSIMIAIAFNMSNPRTTTWLNQQLPEDTLKTGIKTLTYAARVLAQELKKNPDGVAHRLDFVKE